MQYRELKELIDHFEQFGLETGSQDIGPFAYWLHHKLNVNPSPAQEKSEKQLNAKIAEEMGKFSKHYIKKAVKDTPLAGWNDMVAIIILFYGETDTFSLSYLARCWTGKLRSDPAYLYFSITAEKLVLIRYVYPMRSKS